MFRRGQNSAGRQGSFVALLILLTLGSQSFASSAEDRVEEALGELGQRFQISQSPEGWQFRPLSGEQDFRSIEVGHYRVSVDGVKVTGIELRPLVGSEDVERLFLLSNRGHRQVDFVRSPTVAPSADSVTAGSGLADDLWLQILRKFELEIDRALLGKVEPEALQRLKRTQSAGDLRRDLDLTVCRTSPQMSAVLPSNRGQGLDRSVERLAVCSNLSIPAEGHEQAVSVAGGNLKVDGEVRGDVVVTAGQATLLGTVHGNLWVFGGQAEMGPRATIAGSVFLIESTLHTKPGSTIVGTIHRATFQEVVASER